MPVLSRWRRRMTAPFLAVLAACLAVVTGASMTLANAASDRAQTSTPASVTAVSGASGIAPAMACSGVASLDLAAAVPGVPFQVTSAKEVAAAGNTLGDWAYCDVQGVIAPQIHFQLRLPRSTWQANYLQLGCGGLCGNVNTDRVAASSGCVPLTDGAFAVASSDEGHYQGNGLFSTDPTLRADFGYESDHELALAAKAIIEKYYGRPATHSYFDGCSQGGHQALTEAQRYPTDFDGIVAGAPANNFTALNTFSHAWTAQSVFLDGGPATITTADLAPLHAAVLKGCGAPADGIIADPLACHWDPASIRCRTGQTSTASDYCLTADQVTTLRRIYAGPTDEHGKLLYPGYQLRGSELNWSNVIVPTTATGTTGDMNFVRETIRYQIFDSPQPTLTYKDIKFTKAYYEKVMGLGEGMYDATDPDLRAFKKAGGKLILWHGLGDQHIPAVGTMAYYKAVQKTMGGAEATSDFARLFLLPGVAHCGGGQGPDTLDALTAIVDWVTAGQAPDSMLTESLDSGGKVTSARPAYPFPYVAENTTGGSADDPASYTPVRSAAEAGLTLDWLGSFRSGYETVGNWVHGKWVVTKAKA
ncbi:tannase/feruloyl esterase family alpha/beta hydrolase [Streptomyces phaeoluteigriseus]|uniref:Tannase/feruloyl esterase family alpha/beta hydrolase n=1 Tax=Streptomyces phaeoluteigriseus TaxID=114686 RepID=A0ABY4ZCV3_9ACTN|nr:tannase/feruloyl esterase family alpha/beta hydrolase [Streptomyces phaeoluteigriseus]USQ86829.1 tannase/feruloyl esterase family alpha/beta hydrolase [Streptomyces phaeoluteigriseus]